MVGVLAGCAGLTPGRTRPAPAVPQAIGLAELRSVRYFDGHSGERLYERVVLGRALAADAVLLGELHGHELGLAMASTLWEDMLQAAGPKARPALLLEFFERDHQLAIDDYLGGLIEEEAFLAAADRNAGNYPPGHRAMLEATKAAGGAVLAANAPRRYVRLARTEGYDRLAAMTEAQRATFVLPADPSGPPAYRQRFVEAMGGMQAGHGRFGPLDFLRAQLVWDETMADSVAQALRRDHWPVALVVGRFHVEFDGATGLFLRQRRPGTRLLRIVMVDRWSDELAEEDRGRGDVVAYVGPARPAEPAESARPDASADSAQADSSPPAGEGGDA